VQSFSDSRAIRNVLPILWMMSFFYIIGPVGQNQALCHVLLSSQSGGTNRTLHSVKFGQVYQMVALMVKLLSMIACLFIVVKFSDCILLHSS